jgi:hypothetical protein
MGTTTCTALASITVEGKITDVVSIYRGFYRRLGITGDKTAWEGVRESPPTPSCSVRLSGRKLLLIATLA